MHRGLPYSFQNVFFNEQDFLSLEFERCCQTGALKQLKQQDIIKKESVFLKGLFQAIEGGHLELSYFLIHHPSYQNFILRHRRTLEALLQERKILSLFKEPAFVSIGQGIEIGLDVLRTLYNTKLCSSNLKQHINQIKMVIAKLWQNKGLSFQTEKLPLEYEAFLTFCAERNPHHLPNIEKLYLDDPLHRCWRLFNQTQIWFDEGNTSVFFQNQAWTIVLFWLAASDPSLITTRCEQDANLNFRIQFFLQRLAQAPKMVPDFHVYLMQSILAHPHCQLLDEDNLDIELRKHTSTDFQTFDQHMQDQWQHQWVDNPEIQQLAKQLWSKRNHVSGFFYNIAMQSNNPVTNDFLLPLS